MSQNSVHDIEELPYSPALSCLAIVVLCFLTGAFKLFLSYLGIDLQSVQLHALSSPEKSSHTLPGSLLFLLTQLKESHLPTDPIINA